MSHTTEISKPTQWKPSQSGNLNCRPVGTHQAFSAGFLRDLAEVWSEEGRETMVKTARTSPATSQGLSALKPQGNQLGYPSRRRLQLPERHRLPSNRLVRLCHCQPLLKHRRPSIKSLGARERIPVASGLQADSTRAAVAVTSSTFLLIYKRTAALTARGRRQCSIRRSPASETAPPESICESIQKRSHDGSSFCFSVITAVTFSLWSSRCMSMDC